MQESGWNEKTNLINKNMTDKYKMARILYKNLSHFCICLNATKHSYKFIGVVNDKSDS